MEEKALFLRIHPSTASCHYTLLLKGLKLASMGNLLLPFLLENREKSPLIQSCCQAERLGQQQSEPYQMLMLAFRILVGRGGS